MRHAFAVAAGLAAAVGLMLAVPASAQPELPVPPYIDHVEWAHWGDLSSLRVYPTPSGRTASLVATAEEENAAWAEVLALSPDAASPGMYDQFVCHWELAELGAPGKVSWNLEPWRPKVDDATLFSTRCNPGGTEEPF